MIYFCLKSGTLGSGPAVSLMFVEKKKAEEPLFYKIDLGACQIGGITPDGYVLDETGAWTGR